MKLQKNTWRIYYWMVMESSDQQRTAFLFNPLSRTYAAEFLWLPETPWHSWQFATLKEMPQCRCFPSQQETQFIEPKLTSLSVFWDGLCASLSIWVSNIERNMAKKFGNRNKTHKKKKNLWESAQNCNSVFQKETTTSIHSFAVLWSILFIIQNESPCTLTWQFNRHTSESKCILMHVLH